MHWIAKIQIGIVLLLVLTPITAYSQDLNLELYNAAKQGDIATVKALLAKGADVNAKRNNGRTALMHAVRVHAETGGMLLTEGADINAKDNNGMTALMTPASLYGRTEIVKMLLAKGADINAKDNYGITALMYAAKHWHVGAAEILLSNGADVNVKQKDKYGGGRTALMNAYSCGHTEIVDLLKQAGAKE